MSLSLIQQESLPDEVARQQIYNTALEERRQALRAELVKDGVSLNADKEPIHCSGMTCKQVRFSPFTVLLFFGRPRARGELEIFSPACADTLIAVISVNGDKPPAFATCLEIDSIRHLWALKASMLQ